MVAARDIELARETVRSLRAQGQAERAQAVEAVLAAALAIQGAPEPTAAPGYVSLAEAARAFGTEVRTVRQWIAKGHLPTVEADGRHMIDLQTLYAYLDGQRDPPPCPLNGAELAARRRSYKAMVRALPQDKLVRQEALHEKLESGAALSRAERSELAALERELTKAAGRWLEEQTARALACRS